MSTPITGPAKHHTREGDIDIPAGWCVVDDNGVYIKGGDQ